MEGRAPRALRMAVHWFGASQSSALQGARECIPRRGERPVRNSNNIVTKGKMALSSVTLEIIREIRVIRGLNLFSENS